MRLGKRKTISIITAFVMAFTVFGCTGLTFAAENQPDADQDTVGAAQTVDEQDASLDELPDGDQGVNDEDDQNTAPEEPEVVEDPEEDSSVIAMDVSTIKAKVTKDTYSIRVDWDAVAPTHGGAPEDVYYVAYCKQKSGTTKQKETALRFKDLKPYTSYSFVVKAYEVVKPEPVEATDPNETTEPAESTVYLIGKGTFSGKTKAAEINAPVTKTATPGYRKLTLRWKAVKPKNGGKINYSIYASKSSSAKAIRAGLTSLELTRTKLSPRAKTYRYYIKAVELTSSGKVIDRSSLVAFDPVTTIGFSKQRLSGLRADPGYKAVLLEWNKLDGATGYRIYWRKGGERGNIDTAQCSDGRVLKTYRSSKTRKYEVVAKPGTYQYLTTVKQPSGSGKVTYNKRDLHIMNHTYVYFYQFMIVPYYYDKDSGKEIICSNVNNMWKSSSVNGTSQARCQTQLSINVIHQNTVLPMYVLESAKVNKPIYKTHSMGDGKKRGRLSKGHKFICWDKADGRVKFYEKKNVSNPSATYWFAQKNAHVIQGYYLNNGSYTTDLSRSDYATGYSKKTVLDYVNNSGLSSKTGRLVWASKYAQHVYIFKGEKGNWKLINDGKNVKPTASYGAWSNLCSTGKVGIQSRNGYYVIFGKQWKANRAKYDYYCLSKLHKTVRLHSLLYKNGAKFGSGKYYSKVLGNPTSKGCIRLKPEAAEYIYKYVPKKTKSLVY